MGALLRRLPWLVAPPALLVLATTARPGEEAGPVDFARDVRPILSDKCFACHGPDSATRQADLRLDLEAEAFADLGGYAAFVPRDLEASEAWQRIVTDFDADRMPPPDSGLELDPGEVDVLRRWIEEGAGWSRHWSFEAAPGPPRAARRGPGLGAGRPGPLRAGPARGRGAGAGARGGPRRP